MSIEIAKNTYERGDDRFCNAFVAYIYTRPQAARKSSTPGGGGDAIVG